jgi:hypothetical protein
MPISQLTREAGLSMVCHCLRCFSVLFRLSRGRSDLHHVRTGLVPNAFGTSSRRNLRSSWNHVVWDFVRRGTIY